MEDTSAHELVHMYNHCRLHKVDWSNLRHHACSEVTPSPSLSALPLLTRPFRSARAVLAANFNEAS